MESSSFTASRGERRTLSVAISLLLILTGLLSGSLEPTRVGAIGEDLTGQDSAGDLDRGFGAGGKVVSDFSGNDDLASAVAIQPDGKIVVGGTSTARDGTPDFALARYNADGGLDLSFGSAGMVTTDFFADKDSLRALAIQADGKIVGAGSAREPGVGSEFAVARYNADGSLDLSFGAAGKSTVSFPGEAECFGVALTSEGKIVAVGTSGVQTFPRFALARLNTDGGLDPSFGANGKVTNSIAGSSANQACAVALQPDGRIVVAGDDRPSNAFAVFRYNSNGSPDTSFGLGGGAISHVSLSSAASAVALQPDGKIVAAGFAEASLIKLFFGLARFNPNGTADPTFGPLFGALGVSITTRDDAATAIAIQNDGKILAAGFAGAPGEFGTGFADFAIARFKPKGKLDKSFGLDGKVVTDFFGGADSANAMALQSDGKIVLAGVAHAATNVFAVARYLVEDFALAIDPPALTTARGTTVSIDVLINRVGGFAGSVTVTPPDVSALGVKLKPGGPISTTHAKRRLNLKIKSTAEVGPHQLTFMGRDDEGRVRTAVLTLDIQ